MFICSQIVSAEKEGPGRGERDGHLQPAAVHRVRAAHSADEQAEAAQHERPVRPAHSDQRGREHAAGSGCRFSASGSELNVIGVF